MKVIWKFQLNPGRTVLAMWEYATVLTVEFQGDDLMLWAKTDPDAKKIDRVFFTYGTGHDIKDKRLNYIGTGFSKQEGMPLVFHAFEQSPKFLIGDE